MPRHQPKRILLQNVAITRCNTTPPGFRYTFVEMSWSLGILIHFIDSI